MKTYEEIANNPKVTITEDKSAYLNALMKVDVITGIIKFGVGLTAHFVCGMNEGGFEHVSVQLMARRLPTWNEMCVVKDIFWQDEEQVIQIHPKKSQYVNMVEALHLWRPCDGDWGKMNSYGF